MLIWHIWNTIRCAFIWLHISIDCYLIEAARHLLRISADPIRRTLWKFYWFIALVVCCLKRGVVSFVSQKCSNRLTRHSRSGKHGRLGHLIGTREVSHGRSLRSIHFIWFLTTWVTVGYSSKYVLVLISMLGRVKNSHWFFLFSIKVKSAFDSQQTRLSDRISVSFESGRFGT